MILSGILSVDGFWTFQDKSKARICVDRALVGREIERKRKVSVGRIMCNSMVEKRFVKGDFYD